MHRLQGSLAGDGEELAQRQGAIEVLNEPRSAQALDGDQAPRAVLAEPRDQLLK
jgi:hypothetical protein